jgi:hypothetical protein
VRSDWQAKAAIATNKGVVLAGVDAMMQEEGVKTVTWRFPQSEYDRFVVMFLSQGYAELFKVWHAYYAKHDTRRLVLLIVCLDKTAVDVATGHLKWVDNQAWIVVDEQGEIAISEKKSTNDLGELWDLRLNVVLGLMKVFSLGIVMTDVDALWLRDPLALIDKDSALASASLVAGTGSFPPECSLYNLKQTICLGFAVLRSSNATRALLEDAIRKAMGDDQKNVNCAIKNEYEQLASMEHAWGAEMRYRRDGPELTVGLLSADIVKRDKCSDDPDWWVPCHGTDDG